MVSRDISKAFDSVSRGLKALVFGRLGLPGEFCDLFASMDDGNRCVVVTAHGTSEDVLGEESVFEAARDMHRAVLHRPMSAGRVFTRFCL